MKISKRSIVSMLIASLSSTAFADTQVIRLRGGETQDVTLSSTESHTVYQSIMSTCTSQEWIPEQHIPLPPTTIAVCEPIPVERPRPVPRPEPAPQPAPGPVVDDHRGDGRDHRGDVHHRDGRPDDGRPQPIPRDGHHGDDRSPSSTGAASECRPGERFLGYRQVPNWRTIPGHYITREYACPRSVAVGTKTDYQVIGRVRVTLGDAPAGTTADEQIAVTMNGSVLSFSSAGGSGTVILRGPTPNATVTVTKAGDPAEDPNATPGEKVVQADAAYTLLSVADLTAPAAGGVKDLAFNKDSVTFTTGKVMLPEYFRTRVLIKHVRPIISDKEVLNRDLTASDVTLTDMGDRTQVTIDLSKLGKTLEHGKKYRIEIGVSSGSDAQMLNGNILPQFSGANGKTEKKL